MCDKCGYSFLFNLRQPIIIHKEMCEEICKEICKDLEPKKEKWKQLDQFVQSHSNSLAVPSRPYLVLQEAEHESFEEIEHSDEHLNKHINENSKDNNLDKDKFIYKLWCPYCRNDLTAKLNYNDDFNCESLSQYVTARSRSSSTSSNVDFSSLNSSNSNTPEKKLIKRRYSTQSTQNTSSPLVISPRFSSTKRKTIRKKQQASDKIEIKKATSSTNLESSTAATSRTNKTHQCKTSSPSIDSKSKTTTISDSNSISKSTISTFDQYNVETFLNKNKQTGSIKQLTVIRYTIKVIKGSTF